MSARKQSVARRNYQRAIKLLQAIPEQDRTANQQRSIASMQEKASAIDRLLKAKGKVKGLTTSLRLAHSRASKSNTPASIAFAQRRQEQLKAAMKERSSARQARIRLK